MLAYAEENSDKAHHRHQLPQQILRENIAGLTSVLNLIDAHACKAVTILESALDGRMKSDGEIKRCLYEVRDVLARNFSPTKGTEALPPDFDAAIRYYGARVDDIIASL